jgi:hypothetical protein
MPPSFLYSSLPPTRSLSLTLNLSNLAYFSLSHGFVASLPNQFLLLFPYRKGLSEPLGALAALLFIRPFLDKIFLNYIIAFVGGVMVCCPRPHFPLRQLTALSILPLLVSSLLTFATIFAEPPSLWTTAVCSLHLRALA